MYGRPPVSEGIRSATYATYAPELDTAGDQTLTSAAGTLMTHLTPEETTTAPPSAKQAFPDVFVQAIRRNIQDQERIGPLLNSASVRRDAVRKGLLLDQ